jgi:hypothetical protein
VAAHDMIRRAGEILKHAIGVLLLVWRRVLYASGVGGAVAFLLAEAAGCLVSHSFPPPLLTHAVALLFAFAVAWGAALTMFIEELLTGLLDTTHFLEGHVEAGARAAAIIAEREAGEAGRGISRLFGHRPRRQRPPARIAATAPAAPAVAPAPLTEADITRADIAATEEFAVTAPRPAVGARPVPAGRLPRIEWANAPLSPPASAPASGTPADPAPQAPLAEMPPIPLATARDEPGDASGDASSDDARDDDPDTGGGPSIPSAVTDAAGAADDGAAPSLPRPSTTRPLEHPFAERGIWSRISQALVGNVPPPPDLSGSAGIQSGK